LLSIEFNRCLGIDLKIEVLHCSKLLESLTIDQYSKLLKQCNSLPVDFGPSSYHSFHSSIMSQETTSGNLHASIEFSVWNWKAFAHRCKPLLFVYFGYRPLSIARITGSANWEDLTNMWQNLEMLSIALIGFSFRLLPNLFSVAPRLKSLKRITTKKAAYHCHYKKKKRTRPLSRT